MNTVESYSAAVVAGGESRRFGKDKRLFGHSGQPLWMHQLHLLQQLEPAELLISGPKDGPWSSYDYRAVPDSQTGVGPLAGIATLLRCSAHPLLLVLAVDMPEMSASYLRFLVRECSGERGAVPVRGTRFEPLAALYTKSCASIAEKQIASGNFSLQDFVRSCLEAGWIAPVRVLPGEEKLFRNINTPADLVN